MTQRAWALLAFFLVLVGVYADSRADQFVSIGQRQWSYDPAAERSFNEVTYSRDIGTKAYMFQYGMKQKYYLISAAYLGHTEENYSGTRGNQYTKLVDETDNAGINLAFTPRLGPCYLKFGQWFMYHYNTETGERYGESYKERHTGVHRSGEIGFGCGSKEGIYVESSYLNSVYTRNSTVGEEYRQFYMFNVGYSWR